MRLSSLPAPLIQNYIIFVIKHSLPVLKALLPIALVSPCINHLVHAISISLIVVVYMACVCASTFHCNSNNSSWWAHWIVIFFWSSCFFGYMTICHWLKLFRVVFLLLFFHYILILNLKSNNFFIYYYAFILVRLIQWIFIILPYCLASLFFQAFCVKLDNQLACDELFEVLELCSFILQYLPVELWCFREWPYFL